METRQFHPIADVFPLMDGEAYHNLVENIRKQGLLEPVILYEGKILDGRNRYRACMEAGVAVRSQDWHGEGGSPAEFVWSKNAERRQLTASQRAMAAQALLPWLKQEAKERQLFTLKQNATVGPNSDQRADQPPMSGNPGKAAEHAAKLAGVGKSIIYEAQQLSRAAETDPTAAELVQRVKAGEMSVDRASKVLARKDGDEHAAALRRSRSRLAVVAPPPREDANEASKARYKSRPVRVLADYVAGLRLEMERQGLTISQDALDAWWEGAEAREWETIKDNLVWFDRACGPLLKFVHWKASRNSVPPMVPVVERAERRDRKSHGGQEA